MRAGLPHAALRVRCPRVNCPHITGWNYRVMRIPADAVNPEPWLGIREVYYDGEAPRAWSEPTSVEGETIESLRWQLEAMLACLEKPILDVPSEDDLRG